MARRSRAKAFGKRMSKTSQLAKLRELETQARRVRDELRISPRGETLYQAPQSMWSDNDIVVEADGSGGAKLLIVEGNYPIDYLIHRAKRFASEEEACEAADAMAK